MNKLFESFLGNKLDINNLNFYSWRIEIISEEIQDLYCITYNKKIKCIFGDHSF